MSNPTASSLYRADRCPPSQAFPCVRIDSQVAMAGSAGHKFLELVPSIGEELASEEIPENLSELCDQIDLSQIPLGEHFLQEAAWRYNVKTGVVEALGCGNNRRYPEDLDNEWICGTIDSMTLHNPDNQIEIWDYKFECFDNHTPPPAENLQLLFSALCATRYTMKNDAQIGLIHISAVDGSIWKESTTVGPVELGAFDMKLKSIIANIRQAEAELASGKTPDVFRGEWCRFCPAVSSCPAVIGLLRAAASGQINIAKLGEPVDASCALSAYETLRQLDKAVGFAKEALKAYALNHRIKLGNGNEYGARMAEKRIINPDVAYGTLMDLYGASVAQKAVPRSTSLTAIDSALSEIWEKKKAASPGVKITKKSITDATLKTIEELGGLSIELSERVDKHKVKD